jgi:hypothetical protein
MPGDPMSAAVAMTSVWAVAMAVASGCSMSSAHHSRSRSTPTCADEVGR